MCGEISTDLGDNGITTTVANGMRGSKWATPRGGFWENPKINSQTSIDPLRPRFWCPAGATGCTPPTLTGAGQRRGFRWADGRPVFTQVNTILPPNAEVKIIGTSDGDVGVTSPSSRHQGGVHMLIG